MVPRVTPREPRLSNKTLTNAVETALDLCRDACGNGISGQEERSLLLKKRRALPILAKHSQSA